VSLVAKFNNTNAWLSNFSNRVVKLLKIELGRNRTRKYKSGSVNSPINSSGSLSKSLDVISSKSNNAFGYPIKGNSYGEGVDEGVKVAPPVGELIEWIRSKPVKLKDRSGSFVKLTDMKIAQVAKNIQKSIGKIGTQPTNFIDDAIEKAMSRINSIEEPAYKDMEMNLDEIMIKAGYTKEGDNYIIK